MKAETKYKGSIKLSAIGDALGWITEFEEDPKSLQKKYGTDRIDNFFCWKKHVGGRFYGYIDTIKAGAYSDDTQLLLSVARSLKQDGSLDHEYFAKIELANWIEYARGGGRTVKVAAKKIQRKSVTWFNNFYTFKANGQVLDYKQSGANGAAMRVLPIALANLGDFEKIKEEIFCNSIITHGHPRAILGAMLYGYAINHIIVYRPEEFHWEKYITQIGRDFPQKFALTFKNNPQIRSWIESWNKSSIYPFETLYTETLDETQKQLRFIFKSIRENYSVHQTFKSLGCFEPSSKGSGIVTVIAGIYLAAKYHNHPLEAIIEAVNALRSDTDSIAAFTGGLMGALHGHNIIPTKWKQVQDIKYLDKIAERLLAISEDRLEDNPLFKEKKIGISNFLSESSKIGDRIEFTPLGEGKITHINKQPTLTKGKYNLLVEAKFNCGQSILLSKIFALPLPGFKEKNQSKEDELLQIASVKLKPNTFEKLKDFLTSQARLSKLHLEIILTLLKNED